MAELKLGEPFGLSPDLVDKIDWNLTLNRIIDDLKTDFIYAPHLFFIYRKAGDQLIANIVGKLKKGGYDPGVPLTIEVPKSYRIRVAVSSQRLGPNFSRPGSILLPLDRIFYQALADEAVPIIEKKSVRSRSFSHQLDRKNPDKMFVPTRECWRKLQTALSRNSKLRNVNYILKLDIANYFGSINQHKLINLLTDSGYNQSLSKRLEVILTSYTNDRSSRGILQGIYPSDIFGNFYMTPLDRFLDDAGFASARYVDDVYIFVESVEDAEGLMRDLIPFLRSYDLVLNEAKCVIMPKHALNTEEPDLEKLFDDAVQEVDSQDIDESFGGDYGFQSEWEDWENHDNPEFFENIELKATKILFDSLSNYPGHEESIERFCLPLFARAESDYAVNHVFDAFKKRSAMSQIYAAYLAKFIDDKNVQYFLLNMIKDTSLMDWQKMWCIAALLQVKRKNEDEVVKTVMSLLKDNDRHDALRAAAAIYVGRYGDNMRRNELRNIYSKVSTYVQAAIYFTSLRWPSTERNNAKASWGSLNELNKLITIGLKK